MPTFSVKKNPPFVQPHANCVLPEENLSIYTDNLYQSLTIPTPSSHEELPCTEFGTKATSEMPTHTALSFISSTSNNSSNDNAKGGWGLFSPFSNKPRKEKQSSENSDVSETSSRNGATCGGRSKETLMASGTAGSEELNKLSRLSLRTKRKHKHADSRLLCEDINELYGSKNGGRFSD
jgi:hypothetical protein